MKQHEAVEDLLFFLVLIEGLVCLVCTYDLLLLTLAGGYRERLIPHAIAFGIAAAALLLTTTVADWRARLTRRHRRDQPPFTG
jgi:hypothetical protein